ncbi:MAG: PAS domain-containing protein [Haloarculaceae archaeon]|jgi:PAS domain-containing protein
MEERFERAPVGIVEADPDGTVRAANEVAASLLDGATTGEPVATVFPDSVEASVPRAFDTPPDAEHSIEEYYPGPDRWLAVDLVPTDDTVFLYVQDVTERHERERRLEQLNADLDHLTIINELISDILADLVGASTREEIAETICDRLGETDIYEFAWVGERDLGGDNIVVRAAAGETGRTLDRIEACLERDADVPERRAIETASPEVVQPIGEDETVPEPIRRATFADGLQSLLAIPLTYGASVYGVVGVYTADQTTFSERERASFGTVGEMAGFAVNATRNRNLLLSDTVVELTFQLTDPTVPFVAASGEHDVVLTVDGLVPQGDALLCYLAVEGRDPETVTGSLADGDGIDATRVVNDHDGGGTVEVTLGEETLFGRLVAAGATIQSAEFDRGTGRIVVELSPDEDVRRIADTVTRDTDAEVVAKREGDRDITTAREFRDALSDRLTDRQKNALKTAFLANYFESPRGSNAEEVADALDITGPTLLHHLRASQRKLLEEFFETSPEE